LLSLLLRLVDSPQPPETGLSTSKWHKLFYLLCVVLKYRKTLISQSIG
jgi:hypothetical protein